MAIRSLLPVLALLTLALPGVAATPLAEVQVLAPYVAVCVSLDPSQYDETLTPTCPLLRVGPRTDSPGMGRIVLAIKVAGNTVCVGVPPSTNGNVLDQCNPDCVLFGPPGHHCHLPVIRVELA